MSFSPGLPGEAATRPRQGHPSHETSRILINNTLQMSRLSIQPKDFRTVAAKAVRSYVSKHFSGIFSSDDIDDFVSDVVMRMWSGRESFDPEKGKEFSWIWTIAKNVVKDAADAKMKRLLISGAMDEAAVRKMESLAGADDADRNVLNDDLADALLGRLRQERDRRILLYLMQDMEAEEIAHREGISVRAVYMAVYHVRQRLGNAA